MHDIVGLQDLRGFGRITYCVFQGILRNTQDDAGWVLQALDKGLKQVAVNEISRHPVWIGKGTKAHP